MSQGPDTAAPTAPTAPTAQQQLSPLYEPNVGRPIELIVVHCSATPSGQRLGGGLGSRRVSPAMVIDGWHAGRRFARQLQHVQTFNPHLSHIGYHYVVDLDGRIESGRRLREVGAHVAGHNARSLGICLVGGAETQGRYTLRQWSSLRSLVLTLMKRMPDARVVGHRDLSPDADGDGRITSSDWLKTCPGFDVGGWLAAGLQPHPDHVMPEPGAPYTDQAA